MIGEWGILDRGGLGRLVGEELKVCVKEVTGFAVGGDGDEMVGLVG